MPEIWLVKTKQNIDFGSVIKKAEFEVNQHWFWIYVADIYKTTKAFLRPVGKRNSSGPLRKFCSGALAQWYSFQKITKQIWKIKKIRKKSTWCDKKFEGSITNKTIPDSKKITKDLATTQNQLTCLSTGIGFLLANSLIDLYLLSEPNFHVVKNVFVK